MCGLETQTSHAACAVRGPRLGTGLAAEAEREQSKAWDEEGSVCVCWGSGGMGGRRGAGVGEMAGPERKSPPLNMALLLTGYVAFGKHFTSRPQFSSLKPEGWAV